jgi:hypothetical protein
VLGYLAPERLSDGGLMPRRECLSVGRELWRSLSGTGVGALAADGRTGGVMLMTP